MPTASARNFRYPNGIGLPAFSLQTPASKLWLGRLSKRRRLRLVHTGRPPKRRPRYHRLEDWKHVVLVGGQSLTAWVQHYQIQLPQFEGPYLTADADFVATRARST